MRELGGVKGSKGISIGVFLLVEREDALLVKDTTSKKPLKDSLWE